MTEALMIRGATAVLFALAFYGMSKDWHRRQDHLTVVGKRQYTGYYVLMLMICTTVLTNVFEKSPASWLDVARFGVALYVAFVSNWRLHEEWKPA